MRAKVGLRFFDIHAVVSWNEKLILTIQIISKLNSIITLLNIVTLWQNIVLDYITKFSLTFDSNQ